MKRELVALLVVFARDGEEPAATPAAASRRAYSPVGLLIDSRALRVGGRLTVWEETDD